jgi:hypothetical protein
VKYKDATAFRQALEERLKTRAQGDGAELARDRKRVAFDRLLVWLHAVAEDQWLLKGGFALELRFAGRARATKDVNIDWQANKGQLLEKLIDAVEHDAGDYFAFTAERTGAPEDRLGGSHRFRVTASLAGRLFESFLLDVGFRARGGRREGHVRHVACWCSAKSERGRWAAGLLTGPSWPGKRRKAILPECGEGRHGEDRDSPFGTRIGRRGLPGITPELRGEP